MSDEGDNGCGYFLWGCLAVTVSLTVKLMELTYQVPYPKKKKKGISDEFGW